MSGEGRGPWKISGIYTKTGLVSGWRVPRDGGYWREPKGSSPLILPPLLLWGKGKSLPVLNRVGLTRRYRCVSGSLNSLSTVEFIINMSIPHVSFTRSGTCIFLLFLSQGLKFLGNWNILFLWPFLVEVVSYQIRHVSSVFPLCHWLQSDSYDKVPSERSLHVDYSFLFILELSTYPSPLGPLRWRAYSITVLHTLKWHTIPSERPSRRDHEFHFPLPTTTSPLVRV